MMESGLNSPDTSRQGHFVKKSSLCSQVRRAWRTPAFISQPSQKHSLGSCFLLLGRAEGPCYHHPTEPGEICSLMHMDPPQVTGSSSGTVNTPCPSQPPHQRCSLDVAFLSLVLHLWNWTLPFPRWTVSKQHQQTEQESQKREKHLEKMQGQ